jgi:hypothetical protein
MLRGRKMRIVDRKEPIFIYGLIDPRDFVIKYIGQSASPIKRMEQHLSANSSIAVKGWIEELKGKKRKPFMIIFEKVSAVNASFVENAYIEIYKDTTLNIFRGKTKPETEN